MGNMCRGLSLKGYFVLSMRFCCYKQFVSEFISFHHWITIGKALSNNNSRYVVDKKKGKWIFHICNKLKMKYFSATYFRPTRAFILVRVAYGLCSFIHIYTLLYINTYLSYFCVYIRKNSKPCVLQIQMIGSIFKWKTKIVLVHIISTFKSIINKSLSII